MEPRKPDFLIVGAMKSGTSSLGFHLRNHESICMPKGELHFFDREKHYRKGAQWYERKLVAGATSSTRLVGEKTPTYCYLPTAAQRIHDYHPGVKLVWIFREPVARAYSNYLHAFRYGSVRRGFEEAVENEAALIKEDIFHGYMERSRYHKQVRRFLELFDRDRMHFMLFESFIADPTASLNTLFDFLGVSRTGFVYKDKIKGPTVYPRWQTSVWAARQLFGTGAVFHSVYFLNTVLRNASYTRLSKAVLNRYKPRFTEDNRALEALTGLDVSIWE